MTFTNKKTLVSFINEIPKAELHVHFDSVYPELLLRLAKRNKTTLPFSSEENAYRLYEKSDDLESFLKLWKSTTSVIQTEEDYKDIAVAMAAEMKRQNILRTEAMFTYAAAHKNRGIPLDVVINGLSKGHEAAKQLYGVDLYFTADIDRTISSEQSLKFVNDLAQYKEYECIVAVGLDCAEYGYPAEVHTDAFRRAEELGFSLCAHSGEEDGAHSVWSAIRDLHVDRVDHGVRAIEDPDLVKYLAENQIPLTICPSSNSPWIYPTIGDSPFKKFMNSGVVVTINSDDPPFILDEGLPTDLIANFLKVTEAFDLSYAEIAEIARNSFTSSFASDTEKANYLKILDLWLADNLPEEERVS